MSAAVPTDAEPRIAAVHGVEAGRADEHVDRVFDVGHGVLRMPYQGGEGFDLWGDVSDDLDAGGAASDDANSFVGQVEFFLPV